ncbi:hypothetical protein MSG28_002130 [Choristoneura fumiferana]|uniref:Uncharacterized protein n=1 Tax=Choristoneura fumiferana TaxID=7141 RepID=A0ACC0JUF2_CHOFU|nr:hypothetical protein MSG28_002130 [Choristoneura fumiferana]
MDTSSASNFTGCLTLHAETQQCKHCCFTAGLASKMVVAIRADLAQVWYSETYLLSNVEEVTLQYCLAYTRYWTPSRCAKILIDKDVQDLPADLFIFVKGAGCRWWVPAWWCAATPPRARAGAPPAATTTSPCSCRRPCDPPNLTTTLTLHPPPHPYPLTSHFSSPIQKSSIQPRIAALSISIAPLAHSGMADVMSSCKDRCVCRLASHKLCCIHNISDVLSRRVGRRRRGGRAGAGLPAASGETAQAGVKSCLSALLTSLRTRTRRVAARSGRAAAARPEGMEA